MEQHVGVKELDLRLHLPSGTTSSVVDRVSNAVPGFRTSAAFFSFLRANLVLPPSALNSNISTPSLDPSSSGTLPPLMPSSLATMTSHADEDTTLVADPLSNIPPLTTTVLTTDDDKIAALKLVADSVAQQRQQASRALIFHPLTLAAWAGLLAIMFKFLYKEWSDIGVVSTTAAGVTMACLIAVRGLTGEYLNLAEQLKWSFIVSEDGEEDIIIGSRYGEEIIGALTLRLERAGGNGKKKATKNSKTGGHGVVRAWTTRIKYRGIGIGTALLEEAVKVTREKLGNSAEVGFAAEHANSKMILPAMFNGSFKKRETQAAKALEAVVTSVEVKKKR